MYCLTSPAFLNGKRFARRFYEQGPVSGDWKILKGRIKKAWGKITDDEIEAMHGDLNKLEGQLQKTYGISKEEATKEI